MLQALGSKTPSTGAAGFLLVSCWFSAWFPTGFLLACWFIAGFCLASCWFPASVWLLPWSGQIGKLASSFLDMPTWLKTGVAQLGLPGAGVNLLLLLLLLLLLMCFRFFLCAGQSLDAVRVHTFLGTHASSKNSTRSDECLLCCVLCWCCEALLCLPVVQV